MLRNAIDSQVDTSSLVQLAKHILFTSHTIPATLSAELKARKEQGEVLDSNPRRESRLLIEAGVQAIEPKALMQLGAKTLADIADSICSSDETEAKQVLQVMEESLQQLSDRDLLSITRKLIRLEENASDTYPGPVLNKAWTSLRARPTVKQKDKNSLALRILGLHNGFDVIIQQEDLANISSAELDHLFGHKGNMFDEHPSVSEHLYQLVNDREDAGPLLQAMSITKAQNPYWSASINYKNISRIDLPQTDILSLKDEAKSLARKLSDYPNDQRLLYGLMPITLTAEHYAKDLAAFHKIMPVLIVQCGFNDPDIRTVMGTLLARKGSAQIVNQLPKELMAKAPKSLMKPAATK